jgi:hypothetical protein
MGVEGSEAGEGGGVIEGEATATVAVGGNGVGEGGGFVAGARVAVGAGTVAVNVGGSVAGEPQAVNNTATIIASKALGYFIFLLHQ